MPAETKVLALYDFASKQDYIYRTPKIKEISGASELLKTLYGQFAEWLKDDLQFIYDTNTPFKINEFSEGGQVIYDGGGSLMVLFQDEETYRKANQIISRRLLTEVPGLSMLTANTPFTGDFAGDKRKLFQNLNKIKNMNPPYDLPAVTPFTEIDPLTFLPVVYKGTKYTAEPASFSADRVAKQKKYSQNTSDKTEKALNEGMIAVIHIDGNSMGNKLKSVENADYDKGIEHLRAFSKNVQTAFVDNPTAAMEEALTDGKNAGKDLFRLIIAGGDDITILCRATDALRIVRAYFTALKNSPSVIPSECTYNGDPANTACAGLVVAHAKTPFAMLYELAEDACESAKKKAHNTAGNYLDFYYCHEGITADFATLREGEQPLSGRPYAVDDWNAKTEQYIPVLQSAGRANVKALSNAAQMGEIAFALEVERVNAYISAQKKEDCRLTTEDTKIVYDMAEFYDLWFAKAEEKKDGGEEE